MRLFDLHCDTLTKCLKERKSFAENPFDVELNAGLRLAERWVQIAAAFIPDTVDSDQGWRLACALLEYLHTDASVTDNIVLVTNVEALRRSRTKHAMFVIPALENAHALGTSLQRLDCLKAFHVKYVTLTWNGSNALGNGCLSPLKSGLTPFGKQAVHRLYELNITPDVSHLNENGFWDVARIADGRPFIASHSLSNTVHAHPRSLTDEQFCAVRDSGGLVGLNVCTDQLGGEDITCFIRHLEHFLSLNGEDTVALGLDLDGTALPAEWKGIAVVERLYDSLRCFGYSNAFIDRLFYENSYAFFEKSLTIR